MLIENKEFKYKFAGVMANVKATKRNRHYWFEIEGEGIYINAICTSDGRIYGINAKKYSPYLTQLRVDFDESNFVYKSKPQKGNSFIKRIK